MGDTALHSAKTYLTDELFRKMQKKLKKDGIGQAKYLRDLIAADLAVDAPELTQGRPKNPEET